MNRFELPLFLVQWTNYNRLFFASHSSVAACHRNHLERPLDFDCSCTIGNVLYYVQRSHHENVVHDDDYYNDCHVVHVVDHVMDHAVAHVMVRVMMVVLEGYFVRMVVER